MKNYEEKKILEGIDEQSNVHTEKEKSRYHCTLVDRFHSYCANTFYLLTDVIGYVDWVE